MSSETPRNTRSSSDKRAKGWLSVSAASCASHHGFLLSLSLSLFFFFFFFVRERGGCRASKRFRNEWTKGRGSYKADRSKETTSLAADCRKIAFPHYDEIKVSSYIALPTPPLFFAFPFLLSLSLSPSLSLHSSSSVPNTSILCLRSSAEIRIRTAINRRRSRSAVAETGLPVICGVNENKDWPV